jgi:hypothetical protein
LTDRLESVGFESGRTAASRVALCGVSGTAQLRYIQQRFALEIEQLGSW